MELISALETRLLDIRIIDALALRQARLIGRAVSDPTLREEVTTISVLVLAQLQKGSPRAELHSLADPLRPETVALQTAAHPIPETHTSTEGSVYVYVTTLLTQLAADPKRYAPVTGTAPEDSTASWPILVVQDGLIGFSRYWNSASALELNQLPRLLTDSSGIPSDESVRAALDHVFVQQSILDGKRLFHHRQITAAALACRTRFFILSGGPGTGKTSVVLQILRTLLHVYSDISAEDIMLCAPTGRAKARLKESLDDGLDQLYRQYSDDVDLMNIREKTLCRLHSKTIHSLLGPRPDGTFRYNREKKLPHRIIIVDEASMVPLNLFAALIDSCSNRCRIILVGDMHQLPSVEAGAVLGDLTETFSDIPHFASLTPPTAAWINKITEKVPSDGTIKNDPLELNTESDITKAGALADHVVLLTKSYRSSGAIQVLADTINRGDTESALSILQRTPQDGSIVHESTPGTTPVESWFSRHLQEKSIVSAYAALSDLQGIAGMSGTLIDAAATILYSSAVLTLTHEGPRGRKAINRLGERHLRSQIGKPTGDRLCSGMPVILGSNHYDLDLYNGDLGLIIRPEHEGLQVLFPRGKQYRLAPLDRLHDVEPAFALTVHKSQGSEFDSVLLVLPEKESLLLNRQIVYTAITRAKKRVRILGSSDILAAAIRKREKREGGLRIYNNRFP